MIRYCNIIFWALVFVSCNNKYTVVLKAIDKVNETTPAETWDGEYLKSVQLIEGENAVEFYITNVPGEAPKNDDISKKDMIENGRFFIANFMTAYDSSIKGEKGEGDDEMWKQLGPLLKLMAGNNIGIRFKFSFQDKNFLTFDLSPKEVARAVKMRKEDFFDDDLE